MSTILGHRGASADYHENTILAFEAAFEQGAAGVEFDVRRTADGVVVVHHDRDLADGRLILDTAVAELPDEVPTLDAVIETCCRLRPDAIINIEIKQASREREATPAYPVVDLVIEAIDRTRETVAGSATFVVSSFDPMAIGALRSRSDDIATGALSEPLPDLQAVIDAGNSAVMLWVEAATEDYVAAAKAAGLSVGAWTVNEPEDVRRMARYGVDWIMTDYPARSLAALGE